MKTTVYLIRHSVRINTKDVIESWKTSQDKVLRSEKIILSVTGEKRAEILSNEEELQNIDVVYTSNCVRTLQTAKYLLEKQHLKANIDERFDEKRVGKPNDKEYPDWYTRQYEDENFKTEGGESQAEVRERVNEAFQEVVSQNKGKRIAIFAHDYAIMYFLLILPEKKRSKKYNNMLAELQVNDEVLTRGGIVGKIITIDEDQLVIQSGPDRVRIRVTKNSVAQKITKDA